jgi:glycosyltransferase involved in cell wall biosynthesis
MRILYMIPRYWPSVGGAQLHSRELVQRISQHHAVAVVTQFTVDRHSFPYSVATAGNSEYVDGAIRVHRIGPSGAWRPLLRMMSRLYGRFRPVNPVFAVVAQWAVMPHLQEVVRSFRPDLLHAIHIGLVYSSEMAFTAARRRGIPFVWTPLPHIEGTGWRGSRFKRLYRESDALIAMTPRERRWLIEQDAAADRVHVIPVGPLLHPEHNAAAFRATYGLGDAPVILFLAQKLPYKGYRQVAEAAPLVWRHFPEARFAFVGPRTAESELFFACLSDSRIIELPAVDDFTKNSALAACDVFCMPSVQESLGVVYLEAWCFQKPVIAADIEVMTDVISDGQDGLLVKPEPPAIADAIVSLLQDPARRARMGRLGHQKVQEHYDWQKLAEQVVGVYSDLVRSDG